MENEEIIWLGSPREPCQRVRSWDEMRAGMIVYVGPCTNHPEAFHRTMLIGPMTGLTMGGVVDSTDGVAEHFELVPDPHPRTGGASVVTKPFVYVGQLYRVVDLRLEAESRARAEAKPRQKETVDR